jgi:prepilin-type processing-associated H-X9-DG protein
MWTAPPQSGAGWTFQVLPYVEQENVQKTNNPVLARNTAMKLLVCPTRTDAKNLGGGHSTAVNGGPLCYAAAYFGPVTRSATTVAATPGATWGVIVWAEPPENRLSGARDNVVRITTISDGTSNTLLLGEKWKRTDQYNGGAWNDDHNIMSSLDQDGIRVGDQPPLQDTNQWAGRPVTTGQQNPCCDWWRDADTRSPTPRLGSRFGGAHPSGMNALMCDGSVRHIRWGIDQRTFAALCNKADGLVFQLD